MMGRTIGSRNAILKTQSGLSRTVGRFWVTAILVFAVITIGSPVTERFSPVNGFIASAAGRDRIPPTTPTNLHVVTKTASSVSLAWNPSTDNSGSFSYRIRQIGGSEALIPQIYTSYNWTSNLIAGQTYSFIVYAVDAARNRSSNSNTVTVTLPNLNDPPTTPIVSVLDIGPTHISLTWSSTGGATSPRYFVFKDGVLAMQPTADTSGTFYLLNPETTYTFVVQVKTGTILSAPSEPISVTTAQRNPNDVTPPTTPAHFRAEHIGGNEIQLFWDQSTDDFDLQFIIRYDIYVNGVLSDIAIGTGRSLVYVVDGVNIIKIVAIDTAGNQSTEATIEFVM